jgi:hypothetical protein
LNTQLYFGATDANGADGLAFVLQNTGTTALGENGGGLGYWKIPGASFIIEFDTWQNVEPWFTVDDPVEDHIGFMSNGDPYHNSWMGNALKAPESFGMNIEDGQWHDAKFTWDATTHTMTVQVLSKTFSYTGDIVNTIFSGNPMVYWGFTAATGSSGMNEHGVSIVPNMPPPPPPGDCGQLRTQTPGGWGAEPHGNNPGTYLHQNFASVFPNGVTIGLDPSYHATFTTAQAITDYLPAGGQGKALTKNYTNPKTTDLKNVLVQHLLALTLSVGFDQADASFGPAGIHLSEMVISSGAFSGWTVGDFLVEANKVLGGGASLYTAKQVEETAAAINENYVDGSVDRGYLDCPTEAVNQSGLTQRRALTQEAAAALTLRAQPNPSRGQLQLQLAGVSGKVELQITNASGVVIESRSLSLEGATRVLPLDLSRQAAGLYLIRIVSSKGVQTQKILLQK